MIKVLIIIGAIIIVTFIFLIIYSLIYIASEYDMMVEQHMDSICTNDKEDPRDNI